MTEPVASLESWSSGTAYERWVGRWSRRAAPLFLQGLDVRDGAQWADVGCGTGVLAEAILAQRAPAAIAGIDKSEPYVQEARRRMPDARCSFEVGDATRLPWAAGRFDAAVSGLVLNFVPDAGAMARDMVRVTRPGGTVAAYVWDYGGGMQMMRMFWDAAREADPAAAALDQAERFPVCQPDNLRALWASAGLREVDVRSIDFEMPFADFDDFWQPLLGRQGSIPGYVSRLDDVRRDALREALRARMPLRPDGSFVLRGRAWAARGLR